MYLKNFIFAILSFSSIGNAKNLSNNVWYVSKSTDAFTEENYSSAISFNAEKNAGIMFVCNYNQASLSGAIFNSKNNSSKAFSLKRTFIRTKIDNLPITQSYWDSYVSKKGQIDRINPEVLLTLLEQIKKGNDLSVQVVMGINQVLTFNLSLNGSSKAIENALSDCTSNQSVIHSEIPPSITYNYFYNVLKNSLRDRQTAVIEREQNDNNKNLLLIMDVIKHRIENRWRIPPFSTPGTTNTISVWFKRDGTTQRLDIDRSSGDKMFDQSTLIAVRSLDGVPDFSNLSTPFFIDVFQPLKLEFKKPLVKD